MGGGFRGGYGGYGRGGPMGRPFRGRGAAGMDASRGQKRKTNIFEEQNGGMKHEKEDAE